MQKSCAIMLRREKSIYFVVKGCDQEASFQQGQSSWGHQSSRFLVRYQHGLKSRFLYFSIELTNCSDFSSATAWKMLSVEMSLLPETPI